jgi:hypothetical protein
MMARGGSPTITKPVTGGQQRGKKQRVTLAVCPSIYREAMSSSSLTTTGCCCQGTLHHALRTICRRVGDFFKGPTSPNISCKRYTS